jgi:hypothetical protein
LVREHRQPNLPWLANAGHDDGPSNGDTRGDGTNVEGEGGDVLNERHFEYDGLDVEQKQDNGCDRYNDLDTRRREEQNAAAENYIPDNPVRDVSDGLLRQTWTYTVISCKIKARGNHVTKGESLGRA